MISIVSDIDECAMNYDSCEQNCHNTNGSYYCSCITGYRLSIDEFNCDGKMIDVLMISYVFE